MVKYDSTPLTGGPPPIGLLASITVLPSSAAAPTSFSASSATCAGDRQHDELAEGRGLGEGLHLDARMLRRPVRELRRIAGADRDLVAVLQESRRQGLPDHARSDDRRFS